MQPLILFDRKILHSERGWKRAPYRFKEWFFRVKCGSETCYRQTRLPYEFKLIAVIPNMVLETSILSSALSDEQKLNYAWQI